MVESEIVAARWRIGTIHVARAMKTSVVLRPIRMIASAGDGRLRKRAIALKKINVNAVIEPTTATTRCQISMPENIGHPQSDVVFRYRGDLERAAPIVVVHQDHAIAAFEWRVTARDLRVDEHLGPARVLDADLTERGVQGRAGDRPQVPPQLALPRRPVARGAHNSPHQGREEARGKTA